MILMVLERPEERCGLECYPGVKPSIGHFDSCLEKSAGEAILCGIHAVLYFLQTERSVVNFCNRCEPELRVVWFRFHEFSEVALQPQALEFLVHFLRGIAGSMRALKPRAVAMTV